MRYYSLPLENTDADGNLTQKVLATERVSNYTYDPLNHATSQNFADRIGDLPDLIVGIVRLR